MHKIIGIGNAIVDFFIKIEDSFLKENNLVKGSMSLVDQNFVKANLNSKFEKFCSGGSIGNSISNLSLLGAKVEFIGNVGNDHTGKLFIEQIENENCKFKGFISPNQSTASSFIFVSPDGQRTMATYLGCAPQIDPSLINEKLFADGKILFIEGYLWDRPESILSIKKAIKLAKQQQLKIAFSLSDGFCVDRHQKDFLELIKHDIDILFANESEIAKLTNFSILDSNLIQKFISDLNPKLILALTLGAKGSAIFYNDQLFPVEGYEVKNVVDTTGAGDIFASAFLYQFQNGKSFIDCANFANFLASKIIQKFGARFELNEIEKFINEFKK